MNSQFSDIEFKDTMYNPAKVPEEMSIFEYYPQLKKYKIFTKSAGRGIDNQKLMNWIICMYDKNTPYRPKYPDITKRKIEVAHDVGFQLVEGGRFDDLTEDIMKGNNKTANAKIVEFVRIHRQFKYSYLVGIENSYYQIMLQVMGGETRRIPDLRSIQEELENTLLEMLNEDNNPKMIDMVLRYIEGDRLQIRPEDIAMKIAKGEKGISAKEVRG